MTFERLVRDKRFASEVATRAVGELGLERPAAVVIADAHVSADRTSMLLERAHARAVEKREATMIHGLAVPFVGFEETDATEVKPDFAVVTKNPSSDGRSSWLVVGDAKDYERLRSRVADSRLLKGFLQVAVGAESCAMWTRLPTGMQVHSSGVLAVPRNAFLQPEALVEDLADHRAEVRMRVAERRQEAAATRLDETTAVVDHVAHLRPSFDPASCTTCTLFAYCRQELRRSPDATDLLVELGIPLDARPRLIALVDGSDGAGGAAASVTANVEATLSGLGQWTGQRRVDPAGCAGTVNVVIAKSDATALGLHGLALQRVSASGRRDWSSWVYEDPHHPDTRRAAMQAIGRELRAAMREMQRLDDENPPPVHLVVPEKVTADVLVSIADNLAGIELSRLRWKRDLEQGREALTFNGDPAVMPRALSEVERTAVSFLLEEDRARAFKLRNPIVDLRAELARHLVAGGPAVNSLRLDYLVAWSNPGQPVDHRALSDEIEACEHTPGARLVKKTSDSIHSALTGGEGQSKRSGAAADPQVYAELVEAELAYKCNTVDRALDALALVEDSKLQVAHQEIEGAAQAVWRGRLVLHASDLVRFGRTYPWWRNRLVSAIESDAQCHDQLLALANPHAADDLATSAGNRQVAFATVVTVDPIVLDVESRHIADGTRVVLLDVKGKACIEEDAIEVKKLRGSFRIDGLSIGPLDREDVPTTDPPQRLRWTPKTLPTLQPGDRLIVAAFEWFSQNAGNRFLNVARPALDNACAPKPECNPDSYAEAPHDHRFCCLPHEVAEAEFSDHLAARRDRGELNPQTWPPIQDDDAFEVPASGAPVGDPTDRPAEPAPASLTMDDLE